MIGIAIHTAVAEREATLLGGLCLKAVGTSQKCWKSPIQVV
jgi:hypothetical protein